MTSNINEVLNMTLELEGLLMMARERGELVPIEVNQLIQSKAKDILAAVESPCETEDKNPDIQSLSVEPAQQELPCEKIIDEPEPQCPVTEGAVQFADIRKMLSLNDKFLFRRELFDGDEGLFNDTLQLLGTMSSADEVRDYLLNDLCIPSDNPQVDRFIAVVAKAIEK